MSRDSQRGQGLCFYYAPANGSNDAFRRVEGDFELIDVQRKIRHRRGICGLGARSQNSAELTAATRHAYSQAP